MERDLITVLLFVNYFFTSFLLLVFQNQFVSFFIKKKKDYKSRYRWLLHFLLSATYLKHSSFYIKIAENNLYNPNTYTNQSLSYALINFDYECTMENHIRMKIPQRTTRGKERRRNDFSRFVSFHGTRKRVLKSSR